jgi:hypothetical protein
MNSWSKHPVIYETNTWVWLGDLSQKHQRPVNCHLFQMNAS